MAGWIKLNRGMLNWGWYSDANTMRVFVHILLTANHHDGEYHGYPIKRGQAVIGRKEIAAALGIGEQSVRTALKHLKNSGELTIKSTNKFSVATIENWEKYQGDEDEPNQQANQQLTSNQPATNQQPTTSKKEKKEKNNIYSDVPEEIKSAFMEWASMRKQIKKPLVSKKAVTMALNALNKLSQDPEEQIKLIEYATFRNWQSFYPIDEKDKQKPYKPEPPKYKTLKEEDAFDPARGDITAMPDEIRERINKIF